MESQNLKDSQRETSVTHIPLTLAGEAGGDAWERAARSAGHGC